MGPKVDRGERVFLKSMLRNVLHHTERRDLRTFFILSGPQGGFCDNMQYMYLQLLPGLMLLMNCFSFSRSPVLFYLKKIVCHARATGACKGVYFPHRNH